jgi:hypothetical protein
MTVAAAQGFRRQSRSACGDSLRQSPITDTCDSANYDDVKSSECRSLPYLLTFNRVNAIDAINSVNVQ